MNDENFERYMYIIIIIISFLIFIIVTTPIQRVSTVPSYKICYSYPSDVESGLYAGSYYAISHDKNCSDLFNEDNSTFEVLE